MTKRATLKVLPPASTDDPDRLARFERDATVFASLSRPGITGIYGVEEREARRAEARHGF